jgi:hypothetical protein
MTIIWVTALEIFTDFSQLQQLHISEQPPVESCYPFQTCDRYLGRYVPLSRQPMHRGYFFVKMKLKIPNLGLSVALTCSWPTLVSPNIYINSDSSSHRPADSVSVCCIIAIRQRDASRSAWQVLHEYRAAGEHLSIYYYYRGHQWIHDN